MISGAWSSQGTFTPIPDPASLVIPFIGTINGGHVFPGMYGHAISGYEGKVRFPGATLPHGMVKVGMDTDAPGNVYFHHSLLGF